MPGYKTDPTITNPSLAASDEFVVIDGVSMRYGDEVAVDNVSLSVERGAIFGFVGSDGAGKTTLLRMAAAMMRPTAGTIKIGGRDIMKNRAAIKSVIGYMPQRFGLYQDLTVRENIDFFMDIFGIFGRERKIRRERFLRFSNLIPFMNRLAGNLSGGMKQKLGLACVLVHQPDLLILDEPTNGVDPVSRQEFWDILFQMKGQGMTIMISTAYLDEGEKCDCLALMHRSRLIETGIPADIQSHFSDLEEAMIHRIQEYDKELIHDKFQL
ncbi:MAG: ABC transporter ATP-binding protein [Deltaproteobacteria bacterium]|nr:ABC transporter ATP-binding protein [Deltaproteobacteria bacterium]